MKIKLIPVLLGFALLAAAPLSQAQIGVTIGVGGGCNNYYQSCPVYAPPVGVYFGGGSWGSDHRDRGRRYHGDHRR